MCRVTLLSQDSFISCIGRGGLETRGTKLSREQSKMATVCLYDNLLREVEAGSLRKCEYECKFILNEAIYLKRTIFGNFCIRITFCLKVDFLHQSSVAG